MGTLRERRFAVLWLAQFVSLTGDAVYAALLPILVLYLLGRRHLLSGLTAGLGK